MITISSKIFTQFGNNSRHVFLCKVCISNVNGLSEMKQKIVLLAISNITNNNITNNIIDYIFNDILQVYFCLISLIFLKNLERYLKSDLE